MSERDNNDVRYARTFEPYVVAIMMIIVLTVVFAQMRSEIRDLQHRVAVLEESEKR